MTANLSGPLERTSVVPYWSRVQDALSDSPILGDVGAVFVATRMEKLVGRFEVDPGTQAGSCTRDVLIDDALRSVLVNREPSLIVELGAGLDTRNMRLAGLADFVLVDHRPVIEVRERILKTSRSETISADIRDTDQWMPRLNVDKHQRVVFVLSGILCYMSDSDAGALIRTLARHFKGATVVFDLVAPFVPWLEQFTSGRTPPDRPDYRFTRWSERNVHNNLKILSSSPVVKDPRFRLQVRTRQRLMYGAPLLSRASRVVTATTV